MPVVYVASPLGFSDATRPFNATLLGALRDAGFEPLDPWAEPEPFADAETEADFAAVNARLAAQNFESIRRADAVLALLDGADVDSGVAAEVGYAFAHDVPVVGLRLDFRRSGDNPAAPVNLQVHHCLRAWTTTVPAAIRALSVG